jgi:hypothetical protein
MPLTLAKDAYVSVMVTKVSLFLVIFGYFW